jgi:hypothetical protein
VLPLHVGYLFETGNIRNLKLLLPETSLRFDYMKKRKYIGGYER